MAEIVDEKCTVYNGTGMVTNEVCTTCFGQGLLPIHYDYARTYKMLMALTTKIDAIKTMLDSQVYGMQKMSSNLDDIMVKLDV